jgi:potassium inwardly-rectifying channel subfamily J
LEWQWRFTFLALASLYIFSWIIFASAWHLIFWIHGDLEQDHLPQAQERSGHVPCVFNIEGLTSSFLFSVETQVTIGYGLRVPSHQCSATTFLVCIQSIFGSLIEAAIAGLFFVKLSRPKQRAETVIFSKNAVITKRNGKLRLMFQVLNVQKSQLIEAHFRCTAVQDVVTMEGELMKHHQTELRVSTQLDDGEKEEEDRGLLLLPERVSHTINKDSPLYSMSPEDLLSSKVEIILTMEGIVEPSGNTTQARTSYLADEVLWGFRFVNSVEYDEKEGVYKVDTEMVNTVVGDDTHRVSAKVLEGQYRKEYPEL